MKSKLPIAVALATCIGASNLFAQAPQPPSPPTQPSTPPPPTQPGQPQPPQAGPPPVPAPPETQNREERGEREQRHHRRDQGRRDFKPRPFLGIVTMPVPPVVSAQLGLPEGFGLLVENVMPNSPAQQAGVQVHDILKLFNDQQLVEPGQLATLVRAAGKDAQATLTVIRKGQEQKLTVQIGEREMPDRGPFFDMHRQMHDFGRDMREQGPDFHEEMMREHQRRARRNLEEMRERMREQQEGGGDFSAIPPKDVLREAKPGGGTNLSILKNNIFSSVEGSKARFVLKDQEGEIEIASENGNRILTAKNPKGETVFNGPVNTPEQIKAVPQHLREKLEKVQVRTTGPASFRLGKGEGERSENDDVL